jgi:hypothetical protein
MANVPKTKAPSYKTTFNSANNVNYEITENVVSALWRTIFRAHRPRRGLPKASKLHAFSRKKA